MIRVEHFPKRAWFAVLPLFSPWAEAGYAFTDGDLTGEASLLAGAAFIQSHNANFGLGRVDQRNGAVGPQNNSWQEYYLKPGVTLQYAIAPEVALLGGGAFVASDTQGDGDAGGYTRDNDGSSAIEETYAGVQAGEWKVTAGRQNFIVGNGFLVMDGNLDMAGEGAYWAGPRTAFRDTLIARWGQAAVQAQAFSLRTDDHLGDVRLSGANLDYTLADTATLGAMALKVKALSDRQNELTPRDGMQVYNLRALNVKLPGLPALALNGEYALERGSGQGVNYDASAWYVGGEYGFVALPLQPVFGYRYASFSGDPDPADHTRNSWDPLSKGFTDWGTWLVGDVVGNYLLYNSNEDVHTWKLKVHLNETVTLGAMYYQFSLNEKNYFGTPVSSKHFADETALYLEWTPTPQLYASLAYNLVQPQAAARQALGNDNFDALEAYVTYRY